MKVKILAVRSSVLKSSSGDVIITFLYDNIEHTARIVRGQDIGKQIYNAIVHKLDNDMEKLGADLLESELKYLEGSELEIDENKQC